MANQVFKMSLAFHWDIPATMLYNFSKKNEEGVWVPVDITGSSLSDGGFLIDKFAKSGDAFTFQLYEWTHGEPVEELPHGPPKVFRAEAKNFEVEDLFTLMPKFDANSFLPEPKLQSEENETSPFPGLPNLYYWLDKPAAEQLYYIRHIQEEQVFQIRAKAVVPSNPVGSSRSIARTFLFDPEMTVGDDGGTGDEDPSLGNVPSKGSKG